MHCTRPTDKKRKTQLFSHPRLLGPEIDKKSRNWFFELIPYYKSVILRLSTSLYCNFEAVDGGIKVFDIFNLYKTIRTNEREMAKKIFKKMRNWFFELILLYKSVNL